MEMRPPSGLPWGGEAAGAALLQVSGASGGSDPAPRPSVLRRDTKGGSLLLVCQHGLPAAPAPWSVATSGCREAHALRGPGGEALLRLLGSVGCKPPGEVPAPTQPCRGSNSTPRAPAPRLRSASLDCSMSASSSWARDSSPWKGHSGEAGEAPVPAGVLGGLFLPGDRRPGFSSCTCSGVAQAPRWCSPPSRQVHGSCLGAWASSLSTSVLLCLCPSLSPRCDHGWGFSLRG